MRIRFLSYNPHKIKEIQSILKPAGVEILPIALKVSELQTDDLAALVRDKSIRAFQKVGYPLIVEHTGLSIDALNGFPGGLTQIFWDRLGADRISELIGGRIDNGVTAKTLVGFCDGRQVYQFEGSVRGTITATPDGPRDFQWDCIFIPDGQTDTFARMGATRKNEISMRRRALDSFKVFLEKYNVR